MTKCLFFQKWAKVIVIFLFTISFGSKIYSQKLDFVTKIDTVNVNATVLYNINIEITAGKPAFLIAIFDKEPWNGGSKILPVETIQTSSFTFRNLKKGKYYVCVKDVTEIGVCKWVIIQ